MIRSVMTRPAALAPASWLSRLRRRLASPLSLVTGEQDEELHFRSHGVLTLGVEIELQLIDPATCALVPRSEELLKAAAHLPKVKPELSKVMVEVNTGKCRDVQEVESDLSGTLAALLPVGEKLGIAFASTSTHPFANYADSVVYPTERYHELIERYQWLAYRAASVYGLHVHLGMKSGDDCIRFNNFFLYFSPHLLALSSSSPFWQGSDTGLASCRATMYESLPTAGRPYHVRDWREFRDLCQVLRRSGSIKSLKDIWWDIRPSPHYGTLELRMCDGPATLAETTAVVAFIHLLAHWFADNGGWLEAMESPSHWRASENKWRALRHGMNAALVVNAAGDVKPLRDDIEEWAGKLAPYAAKLGYGKYVESLLALCARGTSAERQRRVYARTGSFEEVVKFNIREFLSRRPVAEA